jgi:hypothetical protein
MRSLILAGALLMAGCVATGPGYVHPVYGPAVYVDVTHVHTDDCGHFHHEGYWYVARGHRHGSGCGHVKRDGDWFGEPIVE